VPENHRPRPETYGYGVCEVRVLLSTYGERGDFEPDPETRERASVVAGTIRTDGATAAAKLLLDWSR
jgi:hypothetical protein